MFWWPNGLSHRWVDLEVRVIPVRSPDQDFFEFNLINIQCRTDSLRNFPSGRIATAIKIWKNESMVRLLICINFTYYENCHGKSSQTLTVHIGTKYNYKILKNSFRLDVRKNFFSKSGGCMKWVASVCGWCRNCKFF